MLNQREKGEKVGFVKTAFFEDISEENSFIYMEAGYPVHFVGPSGVEKQV